MTLFAMTLSCQPFGGFHDAAGFAIASKIRIESSILGAAKHALRRLTARMAANIAMGRNG